MKRKRRIYKLKPRLFKKGRRRPPYIKKYMYILEAAKNRKTEMLLGSY